MYRLAIFDFDGTLVDSLPWFRRVVNSVADRHGFRPIAEPEIAALRGMGSRDIVRFMQVPFWKLPAIARDMRRMKSESLSEMPLFPGAGEMLEALAARGVTLAVVSSDTETNVRASLGVFGSLISHYNCGAALFGKAAKYRRLLVRTAIPAHHAISIGDEVRDAEAARQAGIAFGAVNWGYATREALQNTNPEYFFEKMDEIARRLA